MSAMKTTGFALGKKAAIMLKAAVLVIGVGGVTAGVIAVNEQQKKRQDSLRQKVIQNQTGSSQALFDIQQAKILLDMNDLFKPDVLSMAATTEQELSNILGSEELHIQATRQIPLISQVPHLEMKNPETVSFEAGEEKTSEESALGFSSLFQFSGADFDYFNKYGLERNISHAEFMSGTKDLAKYIQSNLSYPEDAYRNGIEGLVEIEFTVEKDGTISNIKTVKGVTPEINAEAERLVANFPKWKPKEINDEKVRSNVHLPIRFEIQ